MREVPYRKELSEGRYHSGDADRDEGNLRTLMENDADDSHDGGGW